jgi:hypothetical protein
MGTRWFNATTPELDVLYKQLAEKSKESLAHSDKGVLQLRRMFMNRPADVISGAPTQAGDR